MKVTPLVCGYTNSMQILKGFSNDYLLLSSLTDSSFSVPNELLGFQLTGNLSGTLVCFVESSQKSTAAIDIAMLDARTFDVYDFFEASNQHIDKQRPIVLDKQQYYLLFEHTKTGEPTYIELGRGGRGRVFSAVNEQGQLVALKKVNSKAAWDAELSNGIRLQNLSPPKGIVCSYDYGQASNSFWLAYPQGVGKLFQIAQLSFEQLCAMIHQLIQALSWLHKNRLFHGDVKIDNVVVTQNGLEFIDFGELTLDLDEIKNQTYFCPDILQNDISSKTETLALGVLIYMMFAMMVNEDMAKHKNINLFAPSYQHLNGRASKNWRPPDNWQSPYAISFKELNLLKQGIYSKRYMPRQRAALNDLFKLVKDMLVLDSQHRCSCEQSDKRMAALRIKLT